MSSQKHNADQLPPEVQLRLVKNRAAEQDRFLNLGRIADALEKIVDLGEQEVKNRAKPVTGAPHFTLRELLRSWARQLLQ